AQRARSRDTSSGGRAAPGRRRECRAETSCSPSSGFRDSARRSRSRSACWDLCFARLRLCRYRDSIGPSSGSSCQQIAYHTVAFLRRFRQAGKFSSTNSMLLRVLYHDHCFDGAAAAAFFSRFIKGAVHPDAEFRYTGMAHKASQEFDPALFDGDENAIVDFKYSSNPRLTWWFDHHQSAFLNAADAEHFRSDTSGRKLYDPNYKSCTSFICKIAESRYGFRAPDLDDLVHWSLIIDGAQYPDARTAVELGAPAMKLTLVIEAAKGSDIVHKIIGWMQQRKLEEIVAEPEVRGLYEPLYERHILSIDLIRSRARQ